jgi:hypothetical protein
MRRTCVGALLVLLLGLCESAQAQRIWYGGGVGTFHGDYFRGLGVAAWGIGVGNYYDAMAESIHVDTMIRLNEYIWASLTREAQENAAHRQAVWKRRLADYQKIRERILNSPEAADVLDGNTLNALLLELQKPDLSDSTFKLYPVPLEPDVVRRIPFKLGEKQELISMSRLALKSTKKWAVEFQDPRYDQVREDYQSAVDAALDVAIDGKMTDGRLQALRRAVENLEARLRREIDQRLFEEASGQLKSVKGTIRLFETHGVQQVLADIDKEPITNVFELKVFMQKHKITFAPAKTPEERKLYPQLQTALREQHQHVATGGGGADRPEPEKNK